MARPFDLIGARSSRSMYISVSPHPSSLKIRKLRTSPPSSPGTAARQNCTVAAIETSHTESLNDSQHKSVVRTSDVAAADTCWCPDVYLLYIRYNSNILTFRTSVWMNSAVGSSFWVCGIRKITCLQTARCMRGIVYHMSHAWSDHRFEWLYMSGVGLYVPFRNPK